MKSSWTYEGESNRRMEELRNEELHDLCSSSNDSWMTKSRRVMQGEGHVTHAGKNCDWQTEGKYRLEGT